MIMALAILIILIEMALFAWWGLTLGRKAGHPTRGALLGGLIPGWGVLIEWLIGRDQRRQLSLGTRPV